MTSRSTYANERDDEGEGVIQRGLGIKEEEERTHAGGFVADSRRI